MAYVTLGYAYGNGRLSAMTRAANGLGQTYNMAYDGFGKLTSAGWDRGRFLVPKRNRDKEPSHCPTSHCPTTKTIETAWPK